MKNIKKSIKQHFLRVSWFFTALGMFSSQLSSLPQITLTHSSAGASAANAVASRAANYQTPATSNKHMTQSQMQQMSQMQQAQQKPGFLEKTLDKLSFLGPDFMSNKLFIQPLFKQVAPLVQGIPMGGQLLQMGVPWAKWVAKMLLGASLNLITGTWSNKVVNRKNGINYSSPLSALNVVTSDNSSGWLRLMQAKGIQKHITKLPGLKNPETFMSVLSVICKIHNAYVLAETLLVLKKIFSSASQTMAEGRQGGPNPFVKLLSNLGSAGIAVHNLASYKAEQDPEETPKSLLLTLNTAMKNNNLAFSAPALATHGLLSAASGKGTEWAMGNLMNIGKTSLAFAAEIPFIKGPWEGAKVLADKYKWWGIGGIAAVVGGFALWIFMDDDAPTKTST